MQRKSPELQDLIGIGIGPFNLSLAALLEKTKDVGYLFFERKPRFDWHPEVMFTDSTMQTSFLKDLVSPIDPTNPHSFLNYLVEKNLFYPFLNTQRSAVSRREFELYCVWVAERLGPKLRFGTEIEKVEHREDHFLVRSARGDYRAKNICVATGLTPRMPECARSLIGPEVFHAKSPHIKNLKLEGRRVVIVGGGQTGIEIFRNALNDRWGHAREVQLVTRRKNLEPLDESAFTNEFFTPNYVEKFWGLTNEKKSQVVASQKLASDGNTPHYLAQLYNDLYRLKHVDHDPRSLKIMACRTLRKVFKDGEGYRLLLENSFLECEEVIGADVVILCTGFQSVIPPMLEPLIPKLRLDSAGRFNFRKSYAVDWDGPDNNRIYALNFSRHNHGIIDPQTSLMAWRSAVVINDLTQKLVYPTEQTFQNFVEYGSTPTTELP